MERGKTEEDILEELLRLGDDYEPRDRKIFLIFGESITQLFLVLKIF